VAREKPEGMSSPASPLLVRSLICHAHVAMGLKCFGSLFRYCDRPIDLRLHDDGSLTPEDIVELLEAFPKAQIIPRAAADELVLERLRGLPHCREFRARFISALKMFDTLLLGDEPFLLLDADVLFFRPFTNLAAPADKALVYLEDSMYAYTLMPWELAAHRELRPVYRLNSGMMLVRGERLDLAFVEHLLQRHPQFRRNWMVEQTLWGILARKYGSLRWDPRQAAVVTDGLQLTPDLVAGHFVSLTRHRLESFLAAPPVEITTPRVALRAEEPALYGAVQLTRDHLRNKFRNGLHRLRHLFLPSAKN
jgi:hypothetical protein